MNVKPFLRMQSPLRHGLLLLSLGSISFVPRSCSAQDATSHTVDEAPAPAIPAILRAFKDFEVVGMPAAHGQKDTDDLILSLIRDPRFASVVDDIVVECGNMRYQPILDRYIAGENIPFTEIQLVWRDTTVQQMCGSSGFYEQLYALVRSINHNLPATRRLRIVAADPPIDWAKIRSYDDLAPFFDRDGNIASVMEREVLSKHRKALMLFGVFHLLHGGGPGEGDAVTQYERHYPGTTFVISDFGYYSADRGPLGDMNASGALWPLLLHTKNSELGRLGLKSFLSSPLTTDQECKVREAFENTPSKTVADQIDAFLYLGPQKLLLAEPLPADIALDRAYRVEWQRRIKLIGLPGPATLEEYDAQTIASAANPVLDPVPMPTLLEETKLSVRQDCLSRKRPAVITPKGKLQNP